jgi:hypothetical protein
MSDDALQGTGPAVEAAEAAAKILEERDKLVELVEACTDEQWESAPLGAEDPRRVVVIADHVADAYGYLTGWMREILGGTNPEVNADLVDTLNAEHADRLGKATRTEVAEHLVQSGDEIVALVAGLTEAQLALFDGRIALLAAIAARHANSHRSEVAAAIGIERAVVDDEVGA